MIVLIDDDSLIYLGWKLKASKLDLTLVYFQTVEEFLLNCDDLSKNCYIYIDSHLKSGIKGEIEAKRIFDKGFNRIYLTTGYSASEFNLNDYPWIIEVLGKSPPF